MSLCWLMQSDFLHGTGRYEPDTGEELYSNADLEYGRQYALDYLAEGITKEPLYGYDLAKFARWCEEKLR